MREPAVRPAGDRTEYFFEEGCYILEMMNTPEDPAVSVARARVPPGVATRWHRLHHITERYLILEGTGRVEVGELPARAVAAGDTVHIPPLCRQRITATGTTDLVFLAVCTPRFRLEAYEDVEDGDRE